MGALFEAITQMRHPLTYAIDIVSGVRTLGPRTTRRLIVTNVLMSVGVGSVLTGVGAGALEVSTLIDPATTAALSQPAVLEGGGIAMGMSAAAGVVQGLHQISKEGQAAREARARTQRARRARESEWLL